MSRKPAYTGYLLLSGLKTCLGSTVYVPYAHAKINKHFRFNLREKTFLTIKFSGCSVFISSQIQSFLIPFLHIKETKHCELISPRGEAVAVLRFLCFYGQLIHFQFEHEHQTIKMNLFLCFGHSSRSFLSLRHLT